VTGKYRRLDQLTKMMTKATDQFRATDPKDRAKRARLGGQQRRLNAARAAEVSRLNAAGTPLGDISAHLDATDPYRRGVPASRPVRQARGSR
jgi:hypothetical protein